MYTCRTVITFVVVAITDSVRSLFKQVKFSEEGSNARLKEQNSYMMFLDYLDDCERGKLIGTCINNNVVLFISEHQDRYH